jgi:hypothetical protein
LSVAGPGPPGAATGVGRRRIVAWSLATGLVVMVAAGLSTGAAHALQVALPVATLGVAVVLYRTDPAAYAALAWWVWILSPNVRRMIDFQAGWNPQSPFSVLPLAVSGLTAFTVVRHLPKLKRRALAPYALLLLGVLHGYLVGFVRVDPLAATFALGTWLVPILLGLYMAIHWRRYPELSGAVLTTVGWGVLALGLYGVAQFFDPAPWDRFWMVKSEMTSIGYPEPYKVRVFSLLNSPGSLAPVLSAGLLLLFASRSWIRVPAAASGMVAFLLSLVRAAWLGWAGGAAVLMLYVPLRSWRRPVLAAAALGAALATASAFAPASITGPLVRAVESRFRSLTDPSQDVSYYERWTMVWQYVSDIAANPAGHGIGATGVGVALNQSGGGITAFDNGVLDVFYSLGWLGGTAFTLGVVWLVVRMGRRVEPAGDLFAKGARAAAVAVLIQLVSGNIFTGVAAATLWTCVGLLTAAHTWHAATPYTSHRDRP